MIKFNGNVNTLNEDVSWSAITEMIYLENSKLFLINNSLLQDNKYGLNFIICNITIKLS